MTKRKLKKISPALGVGGCLIYIHGMGKYMFRVYDNKLESGFTDYDIMHCDLSVTITDADAAFYEIEGCNPVLDHSPETLGIKDDTL